MITIQTKGQAFVLKSHVSVKEKIKAIMGARWNKLYAVWTLPATHNAAKAICAAFPNDSDLTADDAFWAKFRPTQTPSFKHLVTEPWGHQIEAIRFALHHEGCCLWMHMGTGKSLCGVAVACETAPVNVLILCPLAVVGVWPREFRRHSGDTFSVWRSDKGTSARKAKDLSEFLALSLVRHERHVVVINYESAVATKIKEILMSQRWDLIIFDEIHRIKAPGGQRSKFCADLSKRGVRRLGLTGTLMPHSPLDTYAPYRTLDPSVFGRSNTLFKARYALFDTYGAAYQFINQEEMITKVRAIAYEADQSVLDLPEALHDYRTCRLSPSAQKIYKDLERHFYAEVDAGTITPANALVKLLRLQQITSGDTKTDDDEVVAVDDQKEKLLLDVLEDIAVDEPVVVVCKFRPDIDRVERAAEKLGRRFGAICGGRKDGLNDQARMSEEVDLCAVQIQSGGVGIDLTRARYCIFYSLGYSLGDYEQMLARVHRPGQTRPVFNIHLIAEATVDRNVYYALRKRRDVIDTLCSLRPEIEMDLEGGGEISELQMMAVRDAVGMAGMLAKGS